MPLDDDTIFKSIKSHPFFVLIAIVVIGIVVGMTLTSNVESENGTQITVIEKINGNEYPQDLLDEIADEVTQEDGTTHPDNDSITKSINTIANEDDCEDLVKLFIDNYAWHERPSLAIKITKLCL
jgi:hypothetical protein